MNTERTIPTWLIAMLALFAVCVTVYGFFWAQDRVSDSSNFQFLSYAFILITFIVVAVTMGLMIDRYRDGNMKRSSRYRQSKYKYELGAMSSKYKRERRGMFRRY